MGQIHGCRGATAGACLTVFPHELYSQKLSDYLHLWEGLALTGVAKLFACAMHCHKINWIVGLAALSVSQVLCSIASYIVTSHCSVCMVKKAEYQNGKNYSPAWL